MWITGSPITDQWFFIDQQIAVFEFLSIIDFIADNAPFNENNFSIIFLGY